ncbi:Vesicular integral-membrane protein VIP36 [Branchiostoma belcheri]|nr:Vesicular integral-membrane protein VIP36 [Branchiostoma belcheri]
MAVMALLTRCSCVLSAFFAVLAVQAQTMNPGDYMKREHSLMKPYTGTGSMSIPLWDFGGSTMVTDKYVRLTPDHQSRRGSLWNQVPCFVRDWEMHIHFKVHGLGSSLFGDGFAVWYVKDRMQLGPVFGNKDNFVGLGIFFDTYSNHNGPHNHQHPYVSAMVNNGSLTYDHDRDGTHTQLAGCHAQFRNKDHDTHAAIRYMSSQQRLTVMVDVDDKNEWKECFDVTGIRLPQGYYFGSSAATGDLADNHDIISMKMYELDTPKQDDLPNWKEPGADFFAPPRDHLDDPRGAFKNISLSGWKMAAIVFCGLLGVVVCIVVGVVVFQKRQERNMKRFY